MKRDLFAVGHITNDLPPHLGGGVSYSGVAARRLGFQTHIITKCPPNHPYIKELNSYGIIVHNLPVKNPDNENKITTFENIYDDQGNRIQRVPEVQETITVDDLKNFPNISKDAVILIATVAGEVDTQLFPILGASNHLMVTPQGYFRRIAPDGKVNRVPWPEVGALAHAHVTILSDEDLTFNGSQIDQTILGRVTRTSQFTVLTKSKKGSDVYEKDKGLIVHADIFNLQENEVKDLTGAGDTYSASFIAKYEETGDIKKAAVFASLYSALKIMTIEGKGTGLRTAPRLRTIQSFIQMNEERFHSFLEKNGLQALPPFYEDNNQQIERHK